jgi:hypothetical protein
MVLGMSWGALAVAATGGWAGVPRRPSRHDLRPNHLFGIDAVGDWFGATTDMLPVTRAEAMSVPAMARARHLVTMPARLSIRVTPPDFRHTALIEQPDPGRTRAAVLRDTLDDMLFEGVAAWLVTVRYAHGAPRQAERIASCRRAYDSDTQTWLVDGRPVRDEDLIWFEGPHEGVCTFGGRALRSAVRMERAYAGASKSPVVAWELHQSSEEQLSDSEIRDLVAEAQSAVASNGVLFTNAATELKMHAASAENLLISGRNAAAVDIARMVSLPAAALDAHAPGSSGTYDNVQARLREVRDIGLSDYAEAVTDRLSLDDVLPRGVSCSFEWDEVLRPGFKERMDGYAAAQAAGIFTAQECRELEVGPAPEGHA